jgi:group I intron endonuclease
MGKIFIYTLNDPRTNEVRYVGKTNNLRARYNTHLNDKSKTHKNNWIKLLKSYGLKPIMEVIEICGDDWVERERFWISHYDNLTNTLPSAFGPDCGEVISEMLKKKHKDDPTYRIRMGEGFKKTYNNNPELRERIKKNNSGTSNPNYGKKLSDGLKEQLSNIHKGKTLDSSHKEKISQSTKKNGNKPKSVTILGVTYVSAREASRVLGINYHTLRKRVNSKNFPDWVWFMG